MAVAVARTRVNDGPAGVAELEQLEHELRRVQGWAASFGMTELKQQSGQMATRVRRWVDEPEFERGERAALLGGVAKRLTVLAKEPGRVPVPMQARPEPAEVAEPSADPAPMLPAVEVVELETALPEPSPTEVPPEPEPVAEVVTESVDEPASDPVIEPPWEPTPPPGPVVVREPVGDIPDVVIVEDDPDMTRLLVFGMEQCGLRVTTFDNGSVAFEALRGMPARPGRPLVLLDVKLPGFDGHSVQEHLRAERPGMFSFVFVSKRFAEAERIGAIKAGALDYVAKPLSLRVLLTKIPRWMAVRAGPVAFPVERGPVIVPRRRVGAA